MEDMTTEDIDIPKMSNHRPTGAVTAAPQPIEKTEAVGPVFLAIISLLAGPMVSGPLAGWHLRRMGHRLLGWLIGAGLGLAGLGLNAGLLLWPIEQRWTTLTLLLVHLVCAVALLFGLAGPFKRHPFTGQTETPQRGSYRHIITGLVCGGLLSGLWSVASASLYTLASDHLFSFLMPVAFDDEFSLFMLVLTVIPMWICGLFAGGLLGWLYPQARPAQILGWALALLWTQLTWLVALQLSIAVPGFQANAATAEGWTAITIPFTFGQAIVGIGWSIAMLLFVVRPNAVKTRYRRALWVPAINICAAVTLAIALGFPADLFLALGRYQERQAYISEALWCYQEGLRKNPNGQIASYLQYRTALIHHKLGNREKARDGFRRVVTKYNHRPALTQKANRFLDNLQNANADSRRVVLPGVETRTQYKGAYCVPNSLALAMRFWGAQVDAHDIGTQITGLGTGTYVVDQSWYAQQLDFRHDFLPMASLEDIKACIDTGFPVLVYVPAHVFAIVGYDEMLKTFVTYDVATQELWTEYLQEDFIKAWKKQATTLVLAYPGEKAALLPKDIRARLLHGSENYLHFQLHYLDTLNDAPSIAHLEKAAGDKGVFFFPLTILYTEFPSLRSALNANYDVDMITNAIMSYFGNNFDEGTHLAGQYNDEDSAMPDWALNISIRYLIGQRRFDQIEQLLARVDTQGELSGKMQYYNGMVALSQGRYAEGLDRFSRSNEEGQAFYAAFASLKMDDRPRALQGLVETLDGCL
jgi:MFS family permease